MKRIYIIIIGFLISGLFSSCDEYLDVMPDNRTTIDTPDKVAKLLVSAYPDRLHFMVMEPASDNYDENSDNLANNSLIKEAYYQWRTDYESTNDKPETVFGAHYRAIANANLALESIEELGNTPDLQKYRGEAYMARAYAHFLLANIWCKHYSTNSDNDLGMPYMKATEKDAYVMYERGTLSEFYANINDDIEAGLPLIDDNAYKVPKYHFNRKAANAFAARFNLYYGNYDKTIKYASEALGVDVTKSLRDWPTMRSKLTSDEQCNTYVDVTNPATLMLMANVTDYGRYYKGGRYSHNLYIANNETLYASGPWGKTDVLMGGGIWTPGGNNEVGRFIPKANEYFRVTNPIGGTGFLYGIHAVFTTDEILLCRAEAYIMKQDYTNALIDLNMFLANYFKGRSFTTLTLNNVNSFYDGVEYWEFDKPTVKKRLEPDFPIVDKTHENMLHCVLQLRRVLTLHEGLRWPDIKRYGIEIYRRKIDESGVVTVKDRLPKDDPRRAFQIPVSVLSAGFEPNPR
ncbi:RagB/SusD family nutrient uptake outer membrane protein [Prevotella sp. 10(H)]|uniref:RagB/SusD family nutrient uptake outer membrane protein n=1 Tax=Prevotella sp. 10(H) TaxID=1158294 RepID=UPI0004A71085|nr:RagB/SusD family nutrient uptake outer membrane protein [Prevotella sp. 10(H)]